MKNPYKAIKSALYHIDIISTPNNNKRKYQKKFNDYYNYRVLRA